MDIIRNIEEILGQEVNDEQLDKYLSDVRGSLEGSTKQFIAYQFLLLFLLLIYHLIVHEGWSIAVSKIEVKDVLLFDKVFLIIPAAVFIMMASTGYLRFLQREVYDYLSISRYRVLGETGVHELRLPSSYVEGLFVLNNEGGFIGKIVSKIVSIILVIVFFFLPSIYLLLQVFNNYIQFGATDYVNIFVSVLVVLSVVCGETIMLLSGPKKTKS